MKIYVCCDLEGVAGVVDHRQQCAWDVNKEWYAPYLDQARRLATLELNALVEVAIVKEGLYSEPKGLATAPCISLAPGKAHDVIREAASRAIAKTETIRPLRVDPPFTIQVEYREEKFADRWDSRTGVNRINATTVELKDSEHPWFLL